MLSQERSPPILIPFFLKIEEIGIGKSKIKFPVFVEHSVKFENSLGVINSTPSLMIVNTLIGFFGSLSEYPKS